MINVTVGNNLKRHTEPYDENMTLKAILEENEIDYATGTTTLDGATLAPGELNKTLADFNVGEKCFLINVVKADNAA